MGVIMNLIDVIKNRRSIRSFEKKDIDRNIVESILDCGRLAPSAKNRQPWYFIVISGKKKNKIADMMIDYTIKNDDTIERKKMGCASSVNPTANVIKQVPILVLIFREKNENWIVGDNLSIGACVENMCLRATDLGVGSLWIRDTVYVADDVARMLGHEDMEFNCALALGYTKEFPNPRPRKNLREIVEWISD